MIHKRKISIIGLGYVGLTTAVAFGKTEKIIAYDKSPQRIAELKRGYDKNHEVPEKDIKSSKLYLTDNFEDLKEADFHIITVPTPIDNTRRPSFIMLLDVTEKLGKYLKKGDIVVYESTVYPGATEEKCVPVLERESKLIYGEDFTVGYSPERVNPSDKAHTFYNIKKIVSGTDEKTLDIIAETYKAVIKAGVHPVSSIRIAEATKVIENTQRDVNIALMNDFVIMLHMLKIDTREVIEAMKTKWNYISFQPGLVGGHCIGINSYYLMYRSAEAGYYSHIITAARHVNENMARFIVLETIKNLTHMGISLKRARIAVLGLTYKENCSDVRDTSVINIINELKSFDAQVLVHDPLADPEAVKYEFGLELEPWENLNDIDAIILAVAHNQYIDLDKNQLRQKLNYRCLIMDVKSIFHQSDFKGTGIVLWQL
jgi:UDP-N-acetyl-D-glucosamine/UDP-N-acetyl-D-galactosamine dehydrogenase